jgi:hypothetical protein
MAHLRGAAVFTLVYANLTVSVTNVIGPFSNNVGPFSRNVVPTPNGSGAKYLKCMFLSGE